MAKPVICKLNGVAAGAGCSLALACDFIVADEEAQLIEVFINIGLVLDSGSSYFLPRLTSYNKAFELSTMGSRLRAGDAVSMGIVNKAVKADELDSAWTEIAQKAETPAEPEKEPLPPPPVGDPNAVPSRSLEVFG